jgi:spoIIIJ-associated protein
MNRNIEITAKSEEEARQIAESELNENERIIDSEILSAPARGIFGMVGKQEFRMRFSIGAEQPAEEKPDTENESPSSEDEAYEDSYEDSYEDDDDEEALQKTSDRSSERTSERETYREKRRPRHSSNRQGARYQDEPVPERPKSPVSEEIKNHESYDRVFELIREVAINVGVEEIQLEEYMRDGAWVIEASGENVSQLIGKRGKNLDALQYLMNIVLNRGNADRIKLVIDAQGYREKRYRNLMNLASRMSRKALSSRRQIELEPMSTLDRRTVHMALKDKEGIETFSKGSEPMRRVVIAPRKKSQGSRINNQGAWQPIEPDDNQEITEKTETTSSVPMFVEEDA